MGNGFVERFNTLGAMIKAMAPEVKAHWSRHLQTLMFIYHVTVYETMGYASFSLMYGRVPRLSGDVLFNNTLEEHKRPDVTSM